MVFLTRLICALQETVPPVDKNGVFEMHHVQPTPDTAAAAAAAGHVWELTRDGKHVRAT